MHGKEEPSPLPVDKARQLKRKLSSALKEQRAKKEALNGVASLDKSSSCSGEDKDNDNTSADAKRVLDLESKLTVARKEIRKHKDECRNLESKLNAYLKELEHATLIKDSVTAALDDANSKALAQENIVDEKEREWRRKEAFFSEQICDLQAKYEAANDKINDDQSTSNELSMALQQVSKQREEISLLSKKLKDKSDFIDQHKKCEGLGNRSNYKEISEPELDSVGRTEVLKIASLQEKLNESLHKNEILQREASLLNKSLQDMEQEYKDFKCAALTNEDKHFDTVRKLERENKILLNDVSDANNALEKLKNDTAVVLRSKEADMTALIDENSSRLKESEKKIAILKEREKEFQTLREELRLLQNSQGIQNESNDDETQRLRDMLEKLKEEHISEIESLQSKVEGLSSLAVTKQNEIGAMRNEINSFKEALLKAQYELKKEKDNHERQISSLQEGLQRKLQTLKSQKEAAERRAESTESKLKGLQSQQASLSKHNEALEKEKNILSKKVIRLERAIAASEKLPQKTIAQPKIESSAPLLSFSSIAMAMAFASVGVVLGMNYEKWTS